MGDEISESKRQLVGQLTRLTAGFHRIKARLSSERPDRAAYNLLFLLLEDDKRVSDLADIVHSDPSTISRHIAHLVGKGYAERVADQHDGRATRVSITDKGRGFCASMRAQREAGIAKLLQSWSDEDAQQFTSLMIRFNNDVETNFQNVIDGIRQAFDSAEATTETPKDTELPADRQAQ